MASMIRPGLSTQLSMRMKLPVSAAPLQIVTVWRSEQAGASRLCRVRVAPLQIVTVWRSESFASATLRQMAVGAFSRPPTDVRWEL